MRSPVDTAWLKAMLSLAAVWLGLVFILSPTFQNMVAIWESSTNTYSYGYVILPASLWLLWRARGRLARQPAAPGWSALIPMALMGMLWLLARVSGMQVIEQYAFVSMAILAVPACLGWRWFKSALFPFFFLLLMVPNGDILLPHLINYTADFTTLFVRMLGVPIYREGPFLTLPTGHWAVVEACGGLHYLTASITLGLLYAHLTFRTLWKQLAFALAAILVPLLANGLRAVMVVLAGHYSGMTLMIGEDHLWFGWGWFGLVMLATFWVGALWREDLDTDETPAGQPLPPRSPLLIAAASLLLATVFPIWESSLSSRPGTHLTLTAPRASAGWVATPPADHDWTPQWENPDAVLTAHYRRASETVVLYVAYYARQRQGAELISHNNQPHRALRGGWQFVDKTSRLIKTPRGDLEVVEARLRNETVGKRLLVWQWNQVDDQAMTNLFLTKLKLAVNVLLGKPDAGAAIVLAAPYSDYGNEPDERLLAFYAAHKDALLRSLTAP